MRDNGRFSNSDSNDDEQEANWQDSYSDLMTDLLAIFVVLFAFAMMSQAIENAQKSANNRMVGISQKELVGIFDGTDGMLEGENGILPEFQATSSEEESVVEQPEETLGINGEDLEQEMTEFFNTADIYLENMKNAQHVEMSRNNNEILIRLAGSILFPSGKAELSEGVEEILRQVAVILSERADSIEQVRVEGHTDNVPIDSSKYESNWELSTMRAVSVVKTLIKYSSLEEKQFSAIGYGEHQPIFKNETEKNRAKNRRVDIIVKIKEE